MELNVDIRDTVGVKAHLQARFGDGQMDNLADNIVEYSGRRAMTHTSVGSGSGGGGVDEILKRLGNVETYVSELRSQVAAILATIPHLATKADLKDGIAEVKTMIADNRTMIADVKTQVASMETAIFKWIVATVIATSAAAFGLAKYLH
jgi:hypothetical protein